jgi:acyl-CoA thioesterase I
LPMPRAFRTFVLVVVLLLPAAVGAAEKSILVLGDSISAAYGMGQRRGWVALLEERLKEERPDYSVVNASVSGETTSGGRARIEAALAKHRPAVVIVQLGGNDGLRGLPVSQMKDNLGGIIERSQKGGARVLLVGVRMPPNYGPQYTEAFESAYANLSKEYKTALVPSLMEGFGERLEFFQPDRIHPNEAAQPVMADRVWQALRALLGST